MSWVSVRAEPTETIINNGPPENRVDVAIVGDGYQLSEMSKFHSDVQAFVQAMFAQDPYREYQRYFNVHRVDVASNQSGADHPELNVFVDTAFDAAYHCGGTQRLICVNYNKVNAALQRSLTPLQYDIKLVIVNDSEYGGSGGSVAVASTNSQAVEIILHELGHSFGLLVDEYGGTTCSLGDSAPNVTKTTDRNLIKWNYWIDPSTPVPTFTTNPGVPGLYEGALFCDQGYYRPTYNSKMRTLGRPFEQINTEQLVKQIYTLVLPIEVISPTTPTIDLLQGQSQSFSVTKTTPFTHELDVTWFIDGQPQASGATFLFNASSVNTGPHIVDVMVKDNTPWVRRDVDQLLSDTRQWTVNVSSSSPTPTPTPGPTPSSPPVLAFEGADRAIAFDSVTLLRDPLPATSNNNFSGDHRSRISLFATTFDWASAQNPSNVTAQVEFGTTVIPMTVEYFGIVPNFAWLTMIVVRLPDGLPTSGDVGIRIALAGVQSNRVVVALRASP